MAIGKIVTFPIIDTTGTLITGGSIVCYLAGTTTLQNVWNDQALTSSAGSTVTDSDSDGIISFYIDNEISYKFSFYNASSGFIRTLDNYDVQSSNPVQGYLLVTGNTSLVRNQDGIYIYANPSTNSTITLPAISSVPIGWGVSINRAPSNSFTCPIARTGSDTFIDGSTSYSMTAGDTILIVSNGTSWIVTKHYVAYNESRPIVDTLGNNILKFGTVSVPVNYTTITNSSTGNAPIISSAGTDANIGLILDTVGSGAFTVNAGTNTLILDPVSGHNTFQVSGTGNYLFKGTSTTPAAIRLYEQTTNGTNSLLFQTPAALSQDQTITLLDKSITLDTPGMTLLGTITAVNSATVNFTSISNTTYDSYVIIGDNVIPGTNSTNLLFRVSNAGTFATANYKHSNLRFTEAAVGNSGSTSDSSIAINSTSETLGTGSNQTLSFKLSVYNCAQVSQGKRCTWEYFYISSTPVDLGGHGGGAYVGSTAAVDGFSFFMSSGNIASGVFRLYGIRNI